jgi:glutaredoxin
VLATNIAHQVVIFSKSYCGYCQATKDLFSMVGRVQVACHELDKMQNGAAIQDELAEMTGQRSVPNVWVNKRHMGGNDDTQAAFQNGSLEKMLRSTNKL